MNAVRQMTLSLIRKRYFAEQWHALPVASQTLQAGRKMFFAEPLQDHKITSHCVESQKLQSKDKTTSSGSAQSSNSAFVKEAQIGVSPPAD